MVGCFIEMTRNFQKIPKIRLKLVFVHAPPPPFLCCCGCFAFVRSGVSCPIEGGDPNDAKYRRLLEMGFDPARTRSALAEAGGDESAAISRLLSEG